MTYLWLSAAFMALTALAHSVLGERRLIAPILSLDAGVLKNALARQVLRGAWHLTSILMILNGAALTITGMPRQFVLLTGVVWLAVGLFDAAYTKGKHIGWPLLAASGLFAILGGI